KAHDNVNNESLTPPQGGRCYDQALLIISAELLYVNDLVEKSDTVKFQPKDFRQPASETLQLSSSSAGPGRGLFLQLSLDKVPVTILRINQQYANQAHDQMKRFQTKI
ncbi:MAG: hypothetical protein R6V54_08520, partial [Desulfobacteraceae bacterium]